jgi:hypothetical protein
LIGSEVLVFDKRTYRGESSVLYIIFDTIREALTTSFLIDCQVSLERDFRITFPFLCRIEAHEMKRSSFLGDGPPREAGSWESAELIPGSGAMR